jgi:hypothetical protein
MVDQRPFRNVFAVLMLVTVLFQLVASGCATLTFTAISDTDGRGTRRLISNKSIETLYLDQQSCEDAFHGKGRFGCESMKEDLRTQLRQGSYTLLQAPAEADLQITTSMRFFSKKSGMEDFWFFVIPTGSSWASNFGAGNGLRMEEGLDISIVYRVGRQAVSRSYRLYGNDINHVSDLIQQDIRKLEPGGY